MEYSQNSSHFLDDFISHSLGIEKRPPDQTHDFCFENSDPIRYQKMKDNDCLSIFICDSLESETEYLNPKLLLKTSNYLNSVDFEEISSDFETDSISLGRKHLIHKVKNPKFLKVV